jgi:hypothetical protein
VAESAVGRAARGKSVRPWRRGPCMVMHVGWIERDDRVSPTSSEVRWLLGRITDRYHCYRSSSMKVDPQQ